MRTGDNMEKVEWKREDTSQKKRRGREEERNSKRERQICKGRAKWNLH